MNLASIILLILIIAAFIAAIIYMVKNKSLSGCGMRDCDGDCKSCGRMKDPSFPGAGNKNDKK